jgi:hypothetical protein
MARDGHGTRGEADGDVGGPRWGEVLRVWGVGIRMVGGA